MPRKRKRLPARFVLAPVLAIALALATAWVLSPRVRALMTWTAFYRWFTFNSESSITTIPWDQYPEKVEGGDGQFLRRLTRSDPLGKGTRDTLRQYAAASNASALLVVRSTGRRSDPEVLFEYLNFPENPHDLPGRRQLTNSGSMATTALALLVGVAIEKKKITSLDDQVSKYLTEWQGDDRRDIRIRDLLQMSSGLRAETESSSLISDATLMYLSSNLERYVLGVPLLEKPGTAFRPNSVNYQLLTLILERVYGRHYAQILSDELWKPIAAQDAYVWQDHPGGLAKGYCCLSANPIDWARLGLLILHRGQVDGKQVVPASWIREMTTPSRLNPAYGAGIWLPPDRYELRGLHFQNVFILPSRKVVIVRVGNDVTPWRWGEHYLPDLVSRALPGP